MIPHLGLREVNEVALVLGEVLRGPFLLLALILEDLDLVFAAEIVAAAAAAHVRHYCGHASDGHRLPLSLSLSLVFLARQSTRVRRGDSSPSARSFEIPSGTLSVAVGRSFERWPTARFFY